MIRTLLSLLLLLAVGAEASAQTTPAAVTTSTIARTKTTTRRPVKKARVTTRKTTVKKVGAAKASETGGRNDIGPGGNGAVGSTESADGKGQSVYAAPGMPVNVSNPKKVEGYNGKPVPAKSGTTLTPR